MIRRATIEDASRIAEISIFTIIELKLRSEQNASLC